MASETSSQHPRLALIGLLCLAMVLPLLTPLHTQASPAQDAYDLSFAWQKQAGNLRYLDYEPPYFGIVDDIKGSPFQAQVVDWLIKTKGADIGKAGAVQLLSILLLEDANQREQDPDRLLKGTEEYALDALWLALDGVKSVDKTFAKTFFSLEETYKDLADQYSRVLETSASSLRFLQLVESKSQIEDLKEAAHDYAELMSKAVTERERALSETLEGQMAAAQDKKLDKMAFKKILGSGKDIFKYVGAELLQNRPGAFVHTLELFEAYSQAGLIVDSITLGGDLLFGTDNVYTRFGELTLLRELSRILRGELKAQLDTVPWTAGILPGDIETYSKLLLDNLSLFDLLLRVDARGNYVHEQIVYHDAGLLSLTVEESDFFEKSRKLISFYEVQAGEVRETPARLLAALAQDQPQTQPMSGSASGGAQGGVPQGGVPQGELRVILNGHVLWQGAVPDGGYAPLTPVAYGLGYYIQQGTHAEDAYIAIADVGKIQMPLTSNAILVTFDPRILDVDFGSLAVIFTDGTIEFWDDEAEYVSATLPLRFERGELFLSPADLGKIFQADVTLENGELRLKTDAYNPCYSPLWPRTELSWNEWLAILDQLEAEGFYDDNLNADPWGQILQQAQAPGGLLSDVASLTQGRGFNRPLTQEERLAATAQILANRGHSGEAMPLPTLLAWAQVYFGEDTTEPMADPPTQWTIPEAQPRREVSNVSRHEIAEGRYTISYQNVAPDGPSGGEVAIMHFEFTEKWGWRLVLEWVE